MSKEINLGLNRNIFLLFCEGLGQSCVFSCLLFSAGSFPSFKCGLENWLQPVDFPPNNPCDTQKRQALALTRLQLANQDAGGSLKAPCCELWQGVGPNAGSLSLDLWQRGLWLQLEVFTGIRLYLFS